MRTAGPFLLLELVHVASHYQIEYDSTLLDYLIADHATAWTLPRVVLDSFSFESLSSSFATSAAYCWQTSSNKQSW
jgi:hypothetical protein